jgi:D-arabinose 1-dehydrogenase-like Zn-dependent alcohol dehydrogenase
VDQQMQMATALGMQLIYATAIEDANALDRFPVLVRLRNRQDLTRSMRYVRHDGQPATLAVMDGPPTIEVARLVRRETDEQPAHL